MPKVTDIVAYRTSDDGVIDVVATPPEFVRVKFAEFIKQYPRHNFDRDLTFQAVGILPGQFHRWIRKYPELKKRLEICEEGMKDFAEKRLLDFMRMDSKIGMVATLFFLKTKCQERGYVEQIQFNGVVRNEYPKAMVDAVANAAKFGNNVPINITPAHKQIGHDE